MDNEAASVNRDWAVLRHALPDGRFHFDLLVRRASGDGAARVPTWRCELDPVPGVEQVAETLPDHRERYLWYEGPIGGGRGSVSRVHGGALRAADWSGGAVSAELACESGELWQLRVDKAGRVSVSRTAPD